jgi:hypothetical protein
MSWKVIGKSVTGTGHVAVGKVCEDAICFQVVRDSNNEEVLLCCISDGAGSAAHAATASAYCAESGVALLQRKIAEGSNITEALAYEVAEELHDGIKQLAAANNAPMSDFYGTFLGCCITNERAIFFQIGDGAIIRNDGDGFYSTIWWPQTGEYYNFTEFLGDEAYLKHLQVMLIHEKIDELAIFTDGIQLLTLNFDSQTVHQPFFINMFKHLRIAATTERLQALSTQLEGYLGSDAMNNRTDDDKTLLLATRMPPVQD